MSAAAFKKIALSQSPAILPQVPPPLSRLDKDVFYVLPLTFHVTTGLEDP
jgi:hypothetical protein